MVTITLSLKVGDTTAIGATMTGVMETGASVVEKGTSVAVDTGVEDTPQAATEKIGKNLFKIHC